MSSKNAIPITLILLGAATVAVGVKLAEMNHKDDPYAGYPWHIHN